MRLSSRSFGRRPRYRRGRTPGDASAPCRRGARCSGSAHPQPARRDGRRSNAPRYDAFMRPRLQIRNDTALPPRPLQSSCHLRAVPRAFTFDKICMSPLLPSLSLGYSARCLRVSIVMTIYIHVLQSSPVSCVCTFVRAPACLARRRWARSRLISRKIICPADFPLPPTRLCS